MKCMLFSIYESFRKFIEKEREVLTANEFRFCKRMLRKKFGNTNIVQKERESKETIKYSYPQETIIQCNSQQQAYINMKCSNNLC